MRQGRGRYYRGCATAVPCELKSDVSILADTQDQPHRAHGHEQTKDQEENGDRRPTTLHRQYSCVYVDVDTVTLLRGEMQNSMHSQHHQSRASAFGYNASTIPEGAVIRKMLVTEQHRNCPPFVQGISTTVIESSLRTSRGVAEHFRP